MRPLSALDAISPAFSRTRLVLFTPFRRGRSWKLAATGYLTMAGILFFPFPLLYLVALPFMGPVVLGFKTALVIGVVLLTALYIWLFHLCSRLGFAFLEIVLERGEFVAPAWRRHGPASRRWSACKIAFGSLAALALAPAIAAYLRHLIPEVARMAQHPDQAPAFGFLMTFMSGYFLVAAGFLAFGVIIALANDFVVPSLALEQTTLGEAFRRFGRLLRQEPGQVALYAFLKFAFALVGYMAVNLAFEIAFLVVAILVGLVGWALGFALHSMGISIPVLVVLGAAVVVPAFMALAGYLLLLGVGTVATFLQAYLLYFLGGRYPLVSEALERSAAVLGAPANAPPAAFWPPGFVPPPPPGR